MPRLRLALGLAICICAFPASALGAVVSIQGGNTLVYQAAVGEGNSPFIEQVGSNLVVSENVLTLTPGPGCAQGASAQEVVCPAAGVTEAMVDCGDGNDGAQMAVALNTTMRGGDGQDTLTGGGGNDNLIGEQGPDAINGGAGSDTANYSDHLEGVVVDIDGVAGDDGNPSDDDGFGVRDTVNTDVENLVGGRGGDHLTGNAAGNVITGGPGADLMVGDAGVDTASYADHTDDVVADIGGGPNDGSNTDGSVVSRDSVGADIENITGGSGNDSLTGDAVANALVGGLGNDTLKGGAGPDGLAGGDGADTADYAERTEGVTVDIGGGANDGNSADGAPGSRDDVGADVENLRGGSGADSLSGNSVPNAMDGGGGDDAIASGDGNDLLFGGSGDDRMDGGGGADSMGGGDGTDRVTYESRSAPVEVTMDGVSRDGEAGEGDNVGGDVENVTTGGGADSVEGNGSGNAVESRGGEDYVDGAEGGDNVSSGDAKDTVRSRDGSSDTVSCGPDVDFAIADAGDKVAGDCERIDRGVRNAPKVGREVVVLPRGTVGMNLPGVTRFVPLKDRVNLPVRTVLDATAVPVRMTSATGRGRRTQSGTFSQGSFKVTQGKGKTPITQLSLMGGDFSTCPRAGARTAQSSPRRRVRRLFGNAKGRFRFKGRFSSATVRGTRWVMEDRCDGTLTRVLSGSVSVFDSVRKRRIVLRRGQRYLARPRR